jgi:siroheme synthase
VSRSAAAAARPERLAHERRFPPERIIGRHAGAEPGPTLVGIGGVHGNEPAGVRALQRVLAALQTTRPPFHGELVAIAGNLAALEAGRRFVDRELNRRWSRHQVERAISDQGRCAEDREQAELIDVGKGRDSARRTQDEINALLVVKARQGKRVVRLKGGDPFVFGRGDIEVEYLSQHDVPWEVVPGSSSATGVTAPVLPTCTRIASSRVVPSYFSNL